MELSFENYNLGGIKSPPDYRDIALAEVLAPVDLPSEYFVDISNLPIWYQKKIGSCFVAGTMVRMYDGSYKKIEDVKWGDEIIDAYGERQVVVNTFARLWQGNFYEITVYGIGDKLIVTPDHPILTDDGFKEAKNLTKKDNVVIVQNLLVKDKTDNEFENNKDFLRLLGLYIAEGNIEDHNSNGRVTWTLHQKETDLSDFITKVVRDVWNEHTIVSTKTSSLAMSVRVNKLHIARILGELGGSGAINKRIHKRLLTLDSELQKEILIGWLLGDGSFKKDREIYGVSISKELVMQMFDICLRNNIIPSYRIRPAYGIHKESYELTIHGNDKNKLFPIRYGSFIKRKCDSWRGKFKDENLSRRIREIKKLIVNKDLNAQTVYNLETTGSHTYTANFVSVHNCTGQAGGKYCQKQEELESTNIVSFSPRFLYAMAKCQDSYSQEGTYPRLIMKIRQQYGCATEATVPNNCDLSHEEYVYNRRQSNIPQAAFDEASKYKIKSYAAVGNSLAEIKQAVFQANGCMMLVRVGNPWWTDKNGNVTWSATGLFPLRAPEVITGGHEIYVYGFSTLSNGKTEIHFVNSWSKQWGDNGTGWFIYEDYKPFIDECITAIDLPNNFIEEVKKLPAPDKFKHLFIGTIKYGQQNEEVKALQIALKIEGCFPQTQKETSFYGEITRQAVKKFQEKYSVASWMELKLVNGKTVGPATIKKLNSLFYKV